MGAIVPAWLALADIAGNMKSRSLVARQSKVAASSLHVLFADSQQIKQFHDRRDAFQSQQAECCSVRWNVPICGHAPYIAGVRPW